MQLPTRTQQRGLILLLTLLLAYVFLRAYSW
jgi:hypothetical protein